MSVIRLYIKNIILSKLTSLSIEFVYYSNVFRLNAYSEKKKCYYSRDVVICLELTN